MSSKKQVVVIGYGVAGSNIVVKLAKLKKYSITVVSAVNYQEGLFNAI